MAQIIKFSEFLNEKAKVDNDDFQSVFFDVTEELGLTGSYSTKASAYRTNKNDPEEDYKKIMDGLEKAGWTTERIKEEEPNIMEDANKMADQFSSSGGDIFLYYFTKGKNVLAGYNYKQSVEEMPEEYWIKFAYGYHTTKYGKLAIEQGYGSLEKWYKQGADIFIDSLFNDEFNSIETLATHWKADKTLKASLKSGFSYSDGVIKLDLNHVEEKFEEGDYDFFDFLTDIRTVINNLGYKINKSDDNNPGNYGYGGIGKMKNNILVLEPKK